MLKTKEKIVRSLVDFWVKNEKEIIKSHFFREIVAKQGILKSRSLFSKYSIELAEEGYIQERKEGNHIRIRPSSTAIEMFGPKFEFAPDMEDFKKVKEVYVEPKGYKKIQDILSKEKFVIICGAPSIGKTATALHLGIELSKEISRIKFIEPLQQESFISKCMDVKGRTIIFDDAFGKPKAQEELANRFEHFLRFTNGNYVIITSREDVLKEVRERHTVLAEHKIDDFLVYLKEDSYDDIQLGEILQRHLNYYKKIIKITDAEVILAQRYHKEIIRQLRFPHSYEILVESQLKKVVGRKFSIYDAIKDASQPKRVVKHWFLDLDDVKKYFIFTLALFPWIEERKFGIIYDEVLRTLGKERAPQISISKLRETTSSYVRTEGFVDFRHQEYFEGAWDGILEKHGKDVLDIIPFLGRFMQDPDIRLQSAVCLGQLGKVNPELVLPILKELFKSENLYVKHFAFYALGEIGKGLDVFPILHDFIMTGDELNQREVMYVVSQIGIARSDVALSILEKITKQRMDDNSLSKIIRMIGETIRGPLGGKVLPMLEEIKHKYPLLKEVFDNSIREIRKSEVTKPLKPTSKENLLLNSSFEYGLSGWYSTGGSVTYMAVKIAGNRQHCIKGIEEREDNLGRLYQDLTGVLIPGRKYKISGWIKTEEVEAKGERGGAALALNYVDQFGWTPRNGFVMELGWMEKEKKMVGTRDWTYFESGAFTLPPMPSDCSALWFLLDFNDGKGTAYWDDLSLTEVK